MLIKEPNLDLLAREGVKTFILPINLPLTSCWTRTKTRVSVFDAIVPSGINTTSFASVPWRVPPLDTPSQAQYEIRFNQELPLERSTPGRPWPILLYNHTVHRSMTTISADRDIFCILQRYWPIRLKRTSILGRHISIHINGRRCAEAKLPNLQDSKAQGSVTPSLPVTKTWSAVWPRFCRTGEYPVKLA